MSFDFNPVLDIAVEAAEDLSSYQYQFVKIDTSGKAALLDTALDIPVGVLQNTPVAGEGATIRTLGISKMVANAALDEGTIIKPEFVSVSDCGQAAAAAGDKQLACGIVIDASGADGNVCAVLLAIGAGIAGPLVQKAAVATVTTADVVTYTPAQLLGGLIKRDPNGAVRSDVFPLAADIIAAIPNAQIGDSFDVTIINDGNGSSETITMTNGGTGGCTLVGTMTIAQTYLKTFKVLVTSATAVSIYNIGEAVA
jgi:hypothetical protein